MLDHDVTILSSNDYARLQGLMWTMIGSRARLATLLRRKLGSARIMLPSNVGPDLVSSGRRVRFRIDDRRSDERTLVWQPQVPGDMSSLSLQLPRGLALLGLTVGQSIAYRTDSDRMEFLEVESVLPEDNVSGELPKRALYAPAVLDQIRGGSL
jgi:regulator of nucleoside diphosphate kinase